MGNLISWTDNQTNISQQEFKEYQHKMNQIVFDLENKVNYLNKYDSLIQKFENEIQNPQIKESNTQKINWLEEHVDQLSSTINNIDDGEKTELKLKITQLNIIINKLSTSVDDYLQIKHTIKDLEQKIEYLESIQLQTYNINNKDYHEKYDEDYEEDNDEDYPEDNTNIFTNIITSGSSAIYSGIKFPIKMIGNVILPEKIDPETLITNYNDSSNKLNEEEYVDPLLGSIIDSNYSINEKPNKGLFYGLNNLLRKEKKTDKSLIKNDINNEIITKTQVNPYNQLMNQ
jgi:hypothetical protein